MANNTIVFAGSDTHLYDGEPIPFGLGPGKAVSITFPNDITGTIVGKDGTVGQALLPAGRLGEITIRVYSGSPLFNLFVAAERNWLTNPTSSHTWSSTKIVNSLGGTEKVSLTAFQIKNPIEYVDSADSAEDALIREIKFTGVKVN